MGEVPQDVYFSAGQPGQVIGDLPGTRALAEPVEQTAGEVRVQQGIPGGHSSDRVHQVGPASVLESALVAGERDPAALADLARRRLRSKIAQLASPRRRRPRPPQRSPAKHRPLGLCVRVTANPSSSQELVGLPGDELGLGITVGPNMGGGLCAKLLPCLA